MSWQERRCNAEGFGRPEPFFFLCEERTYSPLPRRGSGGTAASHQACALRGDFRFLRKAMDDAGKLLSSTQQARDGTKCSILACCLRKPATGSFAADMGASVKRCTHFLFCERETEIGGERQRQFTIWKRR